MVEICHHFVELLSSDEDEKGVGNAYALGGEQEL
jgi:hypothetical protein